MFIHRLVVRNFRNYRDCAARFEKKLNFIIGPNGTGKTNILEAIAMLSSLKSFRDAADDDMVRWDENYYFLQAWFSAGGGEHDMSMAFERARPGAKAHKRVKWGERVLHRAAEAMGKFPTVLFAPGDLAIVDGGPAERRKFADMVLCQTDGEYFQLLADYNRILKQRNSLLKQVRDTKRTGPDLEMWTAALVDKALPIIEKRKRFMADFPTLLAEAVQGLSDGYDCWQIDYQPSCAPADLAARLTGSITKDIILARTTSGPHLDRWYFPDPTGQTSRDAQLCASQGQKRTLVLALKLAQYRYFRLISGASAAFLVDDVITELDEKRKTRFIGMLQMADQCFFTTTGLAGMDAVRERYGEDIATIEITELRAGAE